MQTDKLKNWALIAEVIASIGVMVTLVFLIIGMRDNTNALQGQTFQELMRDINAWRSITLEHEQSGLWPKYREDGVQGLSGNEQAVIRLLQLQLWTIYEAAYFANERGTLGAEEWIRFETAICQNRQRGFHEFWDQDFSDLAPIRLVLTPRFAEYVDEHCR